MAKRGEDKKKKKKFTKQAILELLEGNEIDLSMSDLTSSTLPIKELVRGQYNSLHVHARMHVHGGHDLFMQMK